MRIPILKNPEPFHLDRNSEQLFEFSPATPFPGEYESTCDLKEKGLLFDATHHEDYQFTIDVKDTHLANPQATLKMEECLPSALDRIQMASRAFAPSSYAAEFFVWDADSGAQHGHGVDPYRLISSGQTSYNTAGIEPLEPGSYVLDCVLFKRLVAFGSPPNYLDDFVAIEWALHAVEFIGMLKGHVSFAFLPWKLIEKLDGQIVQQVYTTTFTVNEDLSITGLEAEPTTTAEPEGTVSRAVTQPFTSVIAGKRHTCGVKTDGSVVCWGSNSYGVATPPQGRFSSVSAGSFHTCGVSEDGSVACWGDDEDGESTPPQGRFSSVSAGRDHTCGVKEDGSVACWGDDENSQATPPQGRFSSVSAGGDHTCGVKEDGSVACWGDDRYGQARPPQDRRFTAEGDANPGDLVGRYQVGQVPYLGWTMLLADGAIYASGSSIHGTEYLLSIRASDGDVLWRSQLDMSALPPVIHDGLLHGLDGHDMYTLDAATGETSWEHSIDDYDGLVVADNMVFIPQYCHQPGCTNGYTALNSSTGQEIWHHEIPSYTAFQPLVANGVFYGGLRDESLFALDQYSGELLWTYEVDLARSPHNQKREWPPTLFDHSLYLTGEDEDGGDEYVAALDAVTGDPKWRYFTFHDESFPTVADGRVFVSEDSDLAEGKGYVALDAVTGEVLWRYGVSDSTTFPPVVSNEIVYLGTTEHLYALAVGDGSLLWQYEIDEGSAPVISESVVYTGSEDGHLYALEANSGELLWRYDVGSSIGFSPVVDGTLVYVRSYEGYIYVLSAGSARAKPAPGGTGIGTTLQSFAMVSAGNEHTCGLREDGSVVCWGDDEYGQATPPQGTFTSVSAGSYHTCGVREDGSVACWGIDNYGRATPPQGTFTSVSAGAGHSCGVREDGSVACWGNNRNGQATAPSGPFSSVSAGEVHACGIREDGSIACWGFEPYGPPGATNALPQGPLPR